jgi:PAS domain S-box-containing protein
LYEYRADEVIGKPISMLLPDGHEEEFAVIFGRLKRGDHIQHFQNVRKTKDGSTRHVAVTISPIVDEKGTIIGASKISQDITKQKEAEEERARLLGELQNALTKVKGLDGFLTVCSACKKIRDNRDQWVPFETYITERSEAVFSHG